jgi:hypothetical protein
MPTLQVGRHAANGRLGDDVLRPVGSRLLERGGELAHIEQALTALGCGRGSVLIIQGAVPTANSTSAPATSS